MIAVTIQWGWFHSCSNMCVSHRNSSSMEIQNNPDVSPTAWHNQDVVLLHKRSVAVCIQLVHSSLCTLLSFLSQQQESIAKVSASVTFRWRLEAVISRQPDQMYYIFEKKYFTALLGGGERMGAHEGSIENPPTVRASHQVYGQPSRTDKKVKIVYCLLSKHFRGLS